VKPGDEVVLLGSQSGAVIGAAEVAATIGTVPHEILCRTGARIVRTYDAEPSPVTGRATP